jgi:lysophospholipase L1-like esterase
MSPHPQTRTRFLSRLSAVALLSFGLAAVAGVAPSSASPGATPNGSAGGAYVALGDSFTAGQGASPSLDDPCLRSAAESYPAIVASTSSYRTALNVACSAATMTDVLGQVASIDPRVAEKASLVTITVGGIDAGVGSIVAACSADPQSAGCAQAFALALQGLPAVGQNLAGTYAAVAAAFPKARIYVLTYPRLFDPSYPDPVTAATLNSATDALNGAITAAVAGAGTSRVALVDVTDAFAAHGIGSADPYISTSSAVEIYHPNAAGNAAYALALREAGAVRGR